MREAKAAQVKEDSPVFSETVPANDGYVPSYIPRETKTVVEVTSTKTEQLLSELVGRLSMDAIREEIRKAIEEELAARGGAGTRDTSAVAERLTEAVAGTIMETAGNVQETVGTEQTGSENTKDESIEDVLGFSVAELLRSQAEIFEGMNVIDMMPEYDQTVIDVSLEDLIKFTSKKNEG